MEKEQITFEEVDTKELNGWVEIGAAFATGVAVGSVIALT